jgi:hypothetical protein
VLQAPVWHVTRLQSGIPVVSIVVVSSAVPVVSSAEPHHDAAPVLSRVETKVFIFVFTQKFYEQFLLAFLKKNLQKYSIRNVDPDSGTN